MLNGYIQLGVHNLAGLRLGLHYWQEAVQLAYGESGSWILVQLNDVFSILDFLLPRSILFVLCTYWNVSYQIPDVSCSISLSLLN